MLKEIKKRKRQFTNKIALTIFKFRHTETIISVTEHSHNSKKCFDFLSEASSPSSKKMNIMLQICIYIFNIMDVFFIASSFISSGYSCFFGSSVYLVPHSLHLQRCVPERLYPILIWFSFFYIWGIFSPLLSLLFSFLYYIIIFSFCPLLYYA